MNAFADFAFSIEKVEPDGHDRDLMLNKLFLPDGAIELTDLELLKLHVAVVNHLKALYPNKTDFSDSMYQVMQVSLAMQSQWLDLRIDVGDDPRLCDEAVQNAMLDGFIKTNPRLQLSREKAISAAIDMITHRNALRKKSRTNLADAMARCALRPPNFDYYREDGFDTFWKAKRNGGEQFVESALANCEDFVHYFLSDLHLAENNLLLVMAHACGMDLHHSDKLCRIFSSRIATAMLREALDQLGDDGDGDVCVTQELQQAINTDLDLFCYASLNLHAELNGVKFLCVKGSRTGRVFSKCDRHLNGTAPLALCPVRASKLGGIHG